MPHYDPPLRHPVHHFARREVDFRRRILTMAVVNRTPDSFYDDGATFALDAALDHQPHNRLCYFSFISGCGKNGETTQNRVLTQSRVLLYLLHLPSS